MEELIGFSFSVLSGVIGNVVYKLLGDSLEEESVKKLVEYKEANDFENFKSEMEQILKYNKQLKQELEKLEKQKSVVQNNVYGNNYYAERDIHINGVPSPKKNLTHLPRKIETFVGREDELNKIIDEFQTSNTLLLVNGVGGIGKSTIAKQFLNTNLEFYNYKAWIDYKDSITSSIISSLNINFGFRGEEKEVYDKIILELNNLESSNNLMIIDNFDNPTDEDRAIVKDFLPNFKILITSREKIDTIKEIEVKELSESEAIELFEKHCHKKYDKGELLKLFEQIGYHSLLIELIAKTIQKSQRHTLISIRERFEKKELKQIKTKVNLKDKKALIVEHIKELLSLEPLSEEQILLLKRFAILPSVEIEFNDLVEMFGIKEDNLDEFENNLNELIERGWISQNESYFKTHQLIIEFVNLENLASYEEVKEVIQYFITKLAKVYSINPVGGFRYIPFVKKILELITEKNEKIANLSNNLSIISKELGDLNSALKYAKKALRIIEEIFDKNYPNLANIYAILSLIYQDLGKLNSALEFSKKSLEITNKTVDKNHPSLANSYSNISLIYKDLGDLKTALEFSKKAIRIKENIFDNKHHSLATSYSNLSVIYQALGNLKNAIEFAEKSLAIREKILDKNHPDLATSYNNFSSIYYNLKNYKKSKEYLLKAIKILETIFPNGHPNIDLYRKNLKILKSKMKEDNNG